jgi:hypothetical protein
LLTGVLLNGGNTLLAGLMWQPIWGTRRRRRPSHPARRPCTGQRATDGPA